MVGGLDAVYGLLDYLVADHAYVSGINEAKVDGGGRNRRRGIVRRRHNVRAVQPEIGYLLIIL